MKKQPGKLFPIWLDLAGRSVRVFSENGNLEQLGITLAGYGADVRLIDESIVVEPDSVQIEGTGKLTRIRKRYDREELFGADLVISGLTDPKENEDLYAACRCFGIPASLLNDPSRSEFYLESEAAAEIREDRK